MCPKDVMEIRMPRRDDDNRLTEPSIIRLEFEKNILDLHIILGEEKF